MYFPTGRLSKLTIPFLSDTLVLVKAFSLLSLLVIPNTALASPLPLSSIFLKLRLPLSAISILAELGTINFILQLEALPPLSI